MRMNGTGSPIEYPTVTIGQETLTVKIGLLAEITISRAGLSLSQAVSSLEAGNKDPHQADYLFQLFAAAVAHNYKEQGLSVLTADEWIDKVEQAGGDPDSNKAIITGMRIALVQAVVKRWPHLKPSAGIAAKTAQDEPQKTETPN